MPRSRKKDIQKIGNLIGNAAAHVVLYPGQYKRIAEALLYFGQASEIAELRTWNEQEIERCQDRAYRRAVAELRKRLPSHRKNEFNELLAQAQQEINEFIAEEMV